MDLNNLKTVAIKPKMELIIPVGHKPSPETQKEEKTFTYVVKAGDTVEKLAQRFVISVDSLLKANQKKTHLVKAGERIVVPKR
jgi:membrane-bound lytic murein transglycosylase D